MMANRVSGPLRLGVDDWQGIDAMQHGMQHYGRGVWVAPWMGPNGELILVALNRHDRQIGEPIMISHGGNSLCASDELWARVERDDPMPQLRVI